MSIHPFNQPLSQQHADYLSLVEISDLHLFDDTTKYYNHINPQQNFFAIMDLMKQLDAQPDLLVMTGDLLQEPSQVGYDNLFSKIDGLNIDYVAIAGNHDVTHELDSHLPFVQRRHIAVAPDTRLVHCQVLQTAYWDLIFLDSTVPGKICGYFSAQTLAWLDQTLATSDKPCVIFCHHPMTKVNSHWIDQHRVQNAEDFWQVVVPHRERLKGIFVGHVHQESHIIHQGISMFTSPATSVQFKPFADDYTLDSLPAGLRWITLYNNGKLATGVKRIDTI